VVLSSECEQQLLVYLKPEAYLAMIVATLDIVCLLWMLTAATGSAAAAVKLLRSNSIVAPLDALETGSMGPTTLEFEHTQASVSGGKAKMTLAMVEAQAQMASDVEMAELQSAEETGQEKNPCARPPSHASLAPSHAVTYLPFATTIHDTHLTAPSAVSRQHAALMPSHASRSPVSFPCSAPGTATRYGRRSCTTRCWAPSPSCNSSSSTAAAR
jgi:hypothetical protein